MNWMNPDNVVHAALNKVGDVVIANLLFLLCSIPLVTIGPALNALYHCMLRTVKGNHTFTVKTFFSAFRQNFIQSFLIWIGLCAAFIITALNLRFLAHTVSPAGLIFFLLTCGTEQSRNSRFAMITSPILFNAACTTLSGFIQFIIIPSFLM